jgi:nucleoside-diphosphate-sugar epimerase
VTGGTGFIGSFLVEHLLDMGARVRVPLRAQSYRALSGRRAEVEWLEGDLRDSEYCLKLVEGVDYVFHLAANRRNVEYHQKRCSDVAQENVRMTLALLAALKERDPVPVTFFSTANVPPTIDTIAISQQEVVDGYVLGKALCETLWFAASHQRSFPLLIVRPVGAYGPRDTFSEEGNVIPAFMVKARDNEKELEVWGNGDQERAFLYVEDLIAAIFKLIDAGAQHIQYITAPDVMTVRELAEKIRDLVRPGLAIRYDPSKPIGGRRVPLVEPHKALQGFKWTPFHEGLKRTYESWK